MYISVVDCRYQPALKADIHVTIAIAIAIAIRSTQVQAQRQPAGSAHVCATTGPPVTLDASEEAHQLMDDTYVSIFHIYTVSLHGI